MRTCTACRQKTKGCGSGGCTNTHMPALTRADAAMLPAAATLTMYPGCGCAANNGGFIPTGACQNAVPCQGTVNCQGWPVCTTNCTGCPGPVLPWGCGGTPCQTTPCGGNIPCHKGSPAGLAILYSAGVSMPGVYGLNRGCPWVRGNAETPPVTMPIDQPAETAQT